MTRRSADSSPPIQCENSLRTTMFIKLFRNVQICVLVLLLLPMELISVNTVPEIFSIQQWTADCQERTTCSARTFSDDELSPSRFLVNFSCHCDTLCYRFGDCCLDHDTETCSTNGTCLHEIQTPEIHQCYSCENVPQIDPNQGLYLISKCPDGWSDDFVRSHCEGRFENDTLLNLPVTGKDSMDNFKNLYCAVCHDVGSYLYWNVQTCCKNTSDDVHDVSSGYTSETHQVCETVYQPPGNSYLYRPCRSSVSTCPEEYTDERVQQLCQNSSAVYVYSKTNTFKNIYCAFCNNVSMEDVLCEEQNVVHRYSLCHGRKRKLPYSFKVLLDMNTNSQTESTRVGMRGLRTTTKNITRHLSCPAKKVYDPFIKACRTVWCQSSVSEDWSDCRPDTGDGVGDKSAESGIPMDCPWIKLNQTEYRLGVNGTIFIRAHQKTYQPSDYRLSGGYAFVCVEFTQNYTEQGLMNGTKIAFNFSETQVYLSLVGVLLSLIALAVHMVVYSLLPTLRNVPGKNLMCLVASLFVAELLFLMAPSLEDVSKPACVSVAIMMHFGFLAAFCWMQVMSFDIWYTFSRKSLHNPSKSKSKSFWMYQIYGWATPTSIVCIAAIVDNLGPTEFPFRPWYGYGICWIANRAGLVLFFAGPVAVVVISNIAFFILTIRSIIEVDKSTSIIQKKSEKHRFFLYVKLCFLMGVAWAFGFLAAFTDIQAMWYLFVILNTLQGMFICVAFVCTKKVHSLLKEKCACKSRIVSGNKSRGTVSSSTRKTSVSSRSAYVVVGQKVEELK